MSNADPFDPQFLDLEFPIRDQCTYLNNAAIGPLPVRSLRAASECLRDQCLSANAGYIRWDECLSRARNRFAALTGAHPDSVAAVSSTTRGLLLVANGLDWKAGDAVIIPEHEFPANVYPWKNLASRGVEVRVVPERGGRFDPADFAAAADEQTRLISVSFVEYSTGFRHDLAAIGRLCRERNILFCVDGIQGLGVIPLDVREAGIDFLSSDGHKWMLGPCGMGFFYCRPELMDRIRFGFRGWAGVDNPGRFEDCDQPPAATARRFEVGSINYPGLHALEKSLELIGEIGVDRIHTNVLALTDSLIEGLERRGYEIVSPRDTRERSGIVAFRSPVFDSLELYRNLHALHIITACRRGWVRVSPHFYNRNEDIECLLDHLPVH